MTTRIRLTCKRAHSVANTPPDLDWLLNRPVDRNTNILEVFLVLWSLAWSLAVLLTAVLLVPLWLQPQMLGRTELLGQLCRPQIVSGWLYWPEFYISYSVKCKVASIYWSDGKEKEKEILLKNLASSTKFFEGVIESCLTGCALLIIDPGTRLWFKPRVWPISCTIVWVEEKMTK